MLHHRTTNPAQRAEHIANREEQIRDQELADKGLNPYIDLGWPEHWLTTYRMALGELVGGTHDKSGTIQHSQFNP